MKTVDYSIEYCHIYANQKFGDEQVESIEALKYITPHIGSSKHYQLTVMVDDYSAIIRDGFDYAHFVRSFEGHGKTAPVIIRESDLINENLFVLSRIKDGKLRKGLKNYIEKKRHPCSLFIATWYLIRLGKISARSLKVQNGELCVGRNLINILPKRFLSQELRADEIISDTCGDEFDGRIARYYI